MGTRLTLTSLAALRAYVPYANPRSAPHPQGCLNTEAKAGTIFPIPFVVHDDAVPANFATVIRTVTILDPCELGFNYCEDAPHCR